MQVDAVQIKLKPGMKLDDVIEQYVASAFDDQEIKKKAREIREYMIKTKDSDPLQKYYELGRMEQFVDSLASDSPEKLRGSVYMTDDRRQAIRRLVALGADPDRRTRGAVSMKEYREYERAYMLAKLPQDLVFSEGLTWSHWFDILEYPRIYEKPELLADLARKCSEEKWASGKTGRLRTELQKINAELEGAHASGS